MKEGWTYKKIKEVGEVVGGTTPSTNNPAFWGGDICWISPAELHGEHYLYDSVKKITAEAVKAKSLKQLPIGTVILSSRAPIGKLAINKVPMYCNQGFKCVICGPEINNEFLYWWFYGKTEYLNSLGTGATFPEISKKVVENITIPLPPLSEQRAIVSRLDASFAHIDALKANAKKQLDDAKVLFQKALEKAMEPKEGWEEKKLGDLGEFKNGMNFAHNERGYDLFLLGVGDFGNLFSINDVKKLSKISLNRKPAEEYLLHNGDIVFVRSNGNKQLVGRSLVVYPNDIHVTFSGFCIRFRRKTNIINEKFLVSYLKSENTRNKLFGNGTNISNLNQKLLQNIIVPLPPLSEQQRIVERLDELSEKVKRLQEIQEKTIKECDALKQAILREVFE